MNRLVALLLVLALASVGYGDVVYASGPVNFLIVDDTGTALTSAGAGAAAGPPDGTYFIAFGNTIGDRYTIEIDFAPGVDNGVLTLFTGNFTSIVDLTNIQWWTGGTLTGSQAVDVPMVSAGTDGLYVANTIYGIPWSTSFDSVIFEFTTQAGSGDNTTFTLDAVSNFDPLIVPEPGTYALFGAGLLALGGFVWRRRSARRS